MQIENEIRLGRVEKLWEFCLKWACIAAGLWIIVFILPGCSDGSYEEQQAIALRNQRFFNACMPGIDEIKEVKWTHGTLICFPKGKPRQPIVVTEEKDYD